MEVWAEWGRILGLSADRIIWLDQSRDPAASAMDSKPVVDEGRARAERTGEVAGADLENQSGTGTAEATRARPTRLYTAAMASRTSNHDAAAYFSARVRIMCSVHGRARRTA